MSDSPFPYIATEQIVDPESGEVLALNGQLLSGEDMERILCLESLPEFGTTGAWTNAEDFRCYDCGQVLRGYDIEFGLSCPQCVNPRWVLKESV